MKDKRNNYNLLFNITYYPNVSNSKDTMSFLHLLLTSDQEHQKVFHKVPIIGFRRAESLKDILARPKVHSVQKNEHFVSIDSFKSTTTQMTCFLKPPNLKCPSKNVVYLFTCKTFPKHFAGSTEDFQPRFNSYRCAHRNLLKKKKS